MKLPGDNSWNTDNVLAVCLLILIVLTVGKYDLLDAIIAVVKSWS